MDIIEYLLPYNDLLEKRDLSKVDMIVFHCTEIPTIAETREITEKIIDDQDISYGTSGHYYIDRDGQVYRYVEDDRVAHHVASYNYRSIGVELVNSGRYPEWYSTKNQVPTEKYTEAQILSSIDLMDFLKQRIPSLSIIKRHSDLDKRLITSIDNSNVKVCRKIDPGPLFPWDKIDRAWHNIVRRS